MKPNNTVYVTGSTGLRELPTEAIASLDRIMEQGIEVHTGDNSGVELLTQLYLAKHKYKNVLLFSPTRKGSKSRCLRFNLGMWPVIPCFGDRYHRDRCMATYSYWLLLVVEEGNLDFSYLSNRFPAQLRKEIKLMPSEYNQQLGTLV